MLEHFNIFLLSKKDKKDKKKKNTILYYHWTI